MNTSESITERPAVRTRTSASTAFATVAFVSLMSWHSLSEARIYKCVANDGSISYSQSECSYKEKTAKVMSSKGRGKSNIDCSIAEGFIRETSNQMRNGVPSGEVFAQYGGLNRVTSVVVSIVNYIYTYAGNLTTTADRVYDLAVQNCQAGTFGIPTCQNMPPEYINARGGCTASDNNQLAAPTAGTTNSRASNNRTTSASANSRNSASAQNQAALDRERRRQERRARRLAEQEDD